MEIEAEGIRKTYLSKAGPVEALAGVDLVVPSGKIFGFLGPNGAGKTTLTRILTTLSRPDAGRARIAGFDVATQAQEVRRRIGYVSQAGGVDSGMSGRANLVLQARLQGMSKSDTVARVGELSDRFGLGELLDRAVKTLSGGQNRRLALAMGLVHRPSVMFLDEPTLGLDPRARVDLWQEISALRADGSTVFLTTHYLEEADALCDELAIIDNGTIVSQGSPAALKREVGSDDVISVTVGAGHARADGARTEIEALAGANRVWWEGDVLRVSIADGGEALPHLLRLLDAAGIEVRSVTLSAPGLDDVFLQKTGRSFSAEGASEQKPKGPDKADEKTDAGQLQGA
ncbi:ATP-binding cassette domain-containing protein [Streptomyces albipurpureus]|uniref:ATP-binding cassette domain-containing protein n=1 Tax=Streptomyces albipurpureus TaxID=2897419 RepID=A0ABT0UIP3_9ACTN|nr:ATP-binding cassette domain-containing protein [Streptomyces sp. CWNU-1]MCM2387965.1 ATP-binding cassette domain-containing protein [Streptomyces sp. CWNU-1]